jgi:hypothetical protein
VEFVFFFFCAIGAHCHLTAFSFSAMNSSPLVVNV